MDRCEECGHLEDDHFAESAVDDNGFYAVWCDNCSCEVLYSRFDV